MRRQQRWLRFITMPEIVLMRDILISTMVYLLLKAVMYLNEYLSAFTDNEQLQSIHSFEIFVDTYAFGILLFRIFMRHAIDGFSELMKEIRVKLLKEVGLTIAYIVHNFKIARMNVDCLSYKIMDRRRCNRYEHDFFIKYHSFAYPSFTTDATIRNVSDSGVCLDTPIRHCKKEKLLLKDMFRDLYKPASVVWMKILPDNMYRVGLIF